MGKNVALMEWEQAKDLLQTALKRSKDGSTMQDVKKSLFSGDAQLWRGKTAVVVTEYWTGDSGEDCNVWLYAGDLKEMNKLDKSAAAYVKHLGMTRMTVKNARKGWSRVLKKLGYIPQGNGDLIKELHNGQ